MTNPFSNKSLLSGQGIYAVVKADKCPLCKGMGKIRGGHVTCPKCGGKKAVAKGDVDGHAFHGNQYEAGQGGGGNLTPSGHRPLSEIARDIETTWAKNSKSGVPYTAKPYLDALKQLHDIKDNYYQDSAKSVVNYLIANMGTFRGEGAAPLKAELKELVK
jgi:RecJ-like exonuclease